MARARTARGIDGHERRGIDRRGDGVEQRMQRNVGQEYRHDDRADAVHDRAGYATAAGTRTTL
jgi:hypothetical protein